MKSGLRVWFTKNALTTGVIETNEVDGPEVKGRTNIELSWARFSRSSELNQHVYYDLIDALEAANRMKARKIQSLKNQLEAMEQFEIKVVMK